MFFFFNDTATTEIYTLSLHDALPISEDRGGVVTSVRAVWFAMAGNALPAQRDIETAVQEGKGYIHFHHADRKSTRLNSSHGYNSYAVFCLKKKTDTAYPPQRGPPHAT